MHLNPLAIDLTGTDLVVLIPIFAAAVVSIITALRTSHKVDAVDAKVTGRNGIGIGDQVDNIATAQALATPPVERTVAMVTHLASEQSGPASDATILATSGPAAPPAPGGTP